MVHAPSPVSRATVTSSPTASFIVALSCLRRPRSDASSVVPSKARTVHTPPVPLSTVPRDSVTRRRRSSRITSNQRRVDAPSRAAISASSARPASASGIAPSERSASCGRAPPGEEIRLEVPLRLLRADARPPHEDQIRAERARRVTGRIAQHVEAVGHAVPPFEGGRPGMHRGVTADGRLVPLPVLRRKVLAGCHAGRRSLPFRRPANSRRMLPAMNARFAGRSARRRMRYGYHCVPNGT